MTIAAGMKLLEKEGFVKANQVGSHIKYSKGEKRITIVYKGGNKTQDLPRKAVKELLKVIESD
jgi:predicted RNA binding protein YcfA (HicA-like mRNA interferase family)